MIILTVMGWPPSRHHSQLMVKPLDLAHPSNRGQTMSWTCKTSCLGEVVKSGLSGQLRGFGYIHWEFKRLKENLVFTVWWPWGFVTRIVKCKSIFPISRIIHILHSASSHFCMSPGLSLPLVLSICFSLL